MSFKQIPLANILMARSSLKTGDFEGFNQYLKDTFSEENVTLERNNVYVLLQDINETVKTKSELESIIPGIKILVDNLEKEGMVIYYDSLIEKIADLNLEVDNDLLDKLTHKNEISRYIIKRLQTGEDQLLDFLTKDDHLGFIEKTEIPGPLLFYSILKNTKDTIGI